MLDGVHIMVTATRTLVNIAVTWNTALQACKTMNAYLLTITDSNEQAFCGQPDNYTWIGGSRLLTTDDWQWETEKTWNYTNWHSSTYSTSTGCLTRANTGSWLSHSCTHSLEYVCERDL